jgi:hypothetical protein
MTDNRIKCYYCNLRKSTHTVEHRYQSFGMLRKGGGAFQQNVATHSVTLPRCDRCAKVHSKVLRLLIVMIAATFVWWACAGIYYATLTLEHSIESQKAEGTVSPDPRANRALAVLGVLLLMPCAVWLLRRNSLLRRARTRGYRSWDMRPTLYMKCKHCGERFHGHTHLWRHEKSDSSPAVRHTVYRPCASCGHIQSNMLMEWCLKIVQYCSVALLLSVMAFAAVGLFLSSMDITLLATVIFIPALILTTAVGINSVSQDSPTSLLARLLCWCLSPLLGRLFPAHQRLARLRIGRKISLLLRMTLWIVF